jgi:Flp pilus assembly protein TadB
MIFLLSIIAALALSAIPIAVGWRRTYSESAMARQMGLAVEKRRFDPEKFALQTGTGLTWNQIVYGSAAWIVGGFIGGLALGPFVSVLFALAGGVLYLGVLSEKRQDYRIQQAKDVLRGVSIMETILRSSGNTEEAIRSASEGVGPHGRHVFYDLLTLMRGSSGAERTEAIQTWTTRWDNPSIDILGTVLISAEENSLQIAPLIAALRETLSGVVEVLSRARAGAKGVEWQAKFLAVFPPAVLVLIGITTPQAGQMYADNPILLLPVLVGSGLSYWLTMKMIRDGLSMEASMGLQSGEQGMITIDRMGRINGV